MNSQANYAVQDENGYTVEEGLTLAQAKRLKREMDADLDPEQGEYACILRWIESEGHYEAM